jgi:IS1 family transposase
LGFAVCLGFTWEVGQTLVDTCPKARLYTSDGCATYAHLVYPQPYSHLVGESKEQTHNVEGVNADLRCYLARLVRQSRCFTRCLEALRCAVRLFQCAYNRRQLLKHEKQVSHVPGMYDCLPALD